MLPKPPDTQRRPGGEGQHQTHRGRETRCPLSSWQRGHCFVFVKILLMRVTHSHSKALARAVCPSGHPRGLVGDAMGGACVASMPSCCRESGLPAPWLRACPALSSGPRTLQPPWPHTLTRRDRCRLLNSFTSEEGPSAWGLSAKERGALITGLLRPGPRQAQSQGPA